MPKNVHLDPEYQSKYRSQPEHVARQRIYKQTIRAKKKALMEQHLGSKCAYCGSSENLELDHINPKVGGHHKARGHRGISTSLKHLNDQINKNNLQWLCHRCHAERTRQQNEAAWNLFINLPLDEQERLMLQCKKS